MKKTKCSEQNGFFCFSFGFALRTSWVSSALWEFISLMSNYASFASRIKKPCFFSGERKWVLSVNLGAEHRKTQFFCVKHQGERTKLIWVNQKKIRFFDERSKTAIIANQWMQNSHSKLLTQLVSNAKPTEKKEKPIELRAFSFFQVNKTFSGFRKWKDGAFFHVPYINRTGKRFSFRQKRLRKQGKH